MPKNFFKTFLVVVSIFLFSAGIVNSVSAADTANPVSAKGCCVIDGGPSCVISDKNTCLKNYKD
ncbi:MAG TPA: hypothetical protein ENL05_01680, partial [Candidatus Moranbacteria bacterium]|nr:hypothetical protein [Candidatus Moranbacteria bacterium]